MSLDEQIQEIGQSLRFIKIDKPTPIIWAVIYWGNNKGEGGCTQIFECKHDHTTGSKLNKAMGVEITRDGKVHMTKTHMVGHQHGIYVSPNENDVSIFLSAYLNAMGLTNPVLERSDEVLLSFCIHRDETGFIKQYASLKYYKQPDGTYLSENGKKPIDGPGAWYLQSKDGKEFIIEYVSNNPTDISLISYGVHLALSLQNEVKAVDTPV